jgi:branched-subunit amino acid ABC-type transport system permease component
MRAMSDDRSLAVVCGLPVRRTTDLTWTLIGFLAAVSREILGLQSHGIDTTLDGSFIYLIFAAIILGGIGRPVGAVLGALTFGSVSICRPCWLVQHFLRCDVRGFGAGHVIQASGAGRRDGPESL